MSYNYDPEQGGVKWDKGKLEWHLLPFGALVPVVRVLMYGKDKYGEENWKKGMPQVRVLDAAMRHIIAYMGGQTRDPETGLSHLAHASCCLLFGLWYEGHTNAD